MKKELENSLREQSAKYLTVKDEELNNKCVKEALNQNKEVFPYGYSELDEKNKLIKEVDLIMFTVSNDFIREHNYQAKVVIDSFFKVHIEVSKGDINMINSWDTDTLNKLSKAHKISFTECIEKEAGKMIIKIERYAK